MLGTGCTRRATIRTINNKNRQPGREPGLEPATFRSWVTGASTGVLGSRAGRRRGSAAAGSARGSVRRACSPSHPEQGLPQGTPRAHAVHLESQGPDGSGGSGAGGLPCTCVRACGRAPAATPRSYIRVCIYKPLRKHDPLAGNTACLSKILIKQKKKNVKEKQLLVGTVWVS